MGSKIELEISGQKTFWKLQNVLFAIFFGNLNKAKTYLHCTHGFERWYESKHFIWKILTCFTKRNTFKWFSTNILGGELFTGTLWFQEWLKRIRSSTCTTWMFLKKISEIGNSRGSASQSSESKKEKASLTLWIIIEA